MRGAVNAADQEILKFLQDKGFRVSIYQLERWRQVGLLPRNRYLRNIGPDGGCPDMETEVLGQLLLFLAAESGRGRPWQLVAMQLLWSDSEPGAWADVENGGEAGPDDKEGADNLEASSLAPDPHVLLPDATLRAMAEYAFAPIRREMRAALDKAQKQSRLGIRARDGELESVLTDAGRHFRRTAIGRAFRDDRLNLLRVLHNQWPTKTGKPRRLSPVDDRRLSDLAIISADWMVADAEMSQYFTTRHRNMAVFGQPRRPRHIEPWVRFPLYSDLNATIASITADEIYDPIRYALPHWQVFGEVHPGGPAPFLRSLIWLVAESRLNHWSDMALLQAAGTPLPAEW